MKNSKLKLADLKVHSFVTTYKGSDIQRATLHILGGAVGSDTNCAQNCACSAIDSFCPQ